MVHQFAGPRAEIAERTGELRAYLLGPAPDNPAPQRVPVVSPKLGDASALAVAMAAEIRGYYFEITPADLLTAWFGETETAVRDRSREGRSNSPGGSVISSPTRSNERAPCT